MGREITLESLTKIAQDFSHRVSWNEIKNKYKLKDYELLHTIRRAREHGLVKDSDLERLVVKSEEHEVPPDDKSMVENLLVALRNELLISIILVDGGRALKASEIREEIRALTNKPLPRVVNFIGYLQDVLVPTGIIAKKYYVKSLYHNVYFSLTEAGRLYRPLAADILMLAVDNGVPIQSLLGKVKSLANPYEQRLRINLIMSIYEGQNSFAYLSGKLKLSAKKLYEHLMRLRSLDLISLKAHASGDGQISYAWIPTKKSKQAAPVANRPTLTYAVAELIRVHNRANLSQLQEWLNYRSPENITRVANGIVEQGLITKTQFYSQLSEIGLTKIGILVAEWYSRLEQAVANKDVPKNKLRQLIELERNPSRFTHYIDRGVGLYLASAHHGDIIKSWTRT